MKISGVLFDIDGTLIDTEVLQWLGWVEILKLFGIELSKKEYIEKYVGGSSLNIEKDLVQKHRLKIPPGTLVRKKEEWMLDAALHKELKWMEYAKEALDYFFDRDYKMGAVSNTPAEEVTIKLKRTGLDKKLPVSVSRNDVVQGKPHPEIYQIGAARIGLKPNEIIAFEDTAIGISSAKNAGIFCVAIPNEYTKIQNFDHADLVCKNFKEALKKLGKQLC